MTPARTRAAVLGSAGALVVFVAGCGGQPSVVPAGSAGVEIAVQNSAPPAPDSGADDQPRPTRAPKAAAAAGPKASEPPARASAAAPAKKASSAATAVAAPARELAVAPKTSASAVGKRARPRTAAALPGTGTYTYSVTGSSSLGPPSKTSTLTVADAGRGAQLWTLDSRREDGAGLIEELTLSRSDAGVQLSAYRLDASTGIAGVILEFAPAAPVLLTPSTGRSGTTWPFDLGISADGCAKAKGIGELLDPGRGTGDRLFRVTTTVRTVGPASCIALEGDRVQDISHPTTSLLPTRIESDLRGTVAGVAFKATTDATRSQPAGDTTGALQRIVAVDRVRR